MGNRRQNRSLSMKGGLPSLILLADDFNDNTQNVKEWVKEAYRATNQAVTVEEIGGRLVITPLTSTPGTNYNGYGSVRTFNFTGRYMQIELVQRATNWAINDVLITATAGEPATVAGFDVEHNFIYPVIVVEGVYDFTEEAYDDVNMRWLRFRHEPSDDTFRWEVSPDGSVWTQIRSAPRAFDIRSVQFHINSGTYDPNAAPGQMIVDNFEAGVSV